MRLSYIYPGLLCYIDVFIYGLLQRIIFAALGMRQRSANRGSDQENTAFVKLGLSRVNICLVATAFLHFCFPVASVLRVPLNGLREELYKFLYTSCK